MFGFVYLFNGISKPYGLYNDEILFICKCLIIIMTIYIWFCCLMACQLFIDYLMPKLDLFINVWL